MYSWFRWPAVGAVIGVAYRLDLAIDLDESVRRVARDQCDTAIADLRRIDSSDAVEAVHDVRKRCKKIRGLVRLVRPALDGQYSEANVVFRDAGRRLSIYRDSHALLATFDDVIAASTGRLPDGGVGAVRTELARRASTSTETLDGGCADVVEALKLLEVGRAAIDEWELDATGRDAIDGGVATTYRRGSKALAATIDKPKVKRFHELRKRVKYTWFHLRLLESSAPSLLGPLADRWHDLADALGDAHDLAELRRCLHDDIESFGGDVDGVVLLIDGHRELLERRSLALGSRLFADDVECFTARLGGYWDAHRRWGDEPDIGAIPDLFPASGSADDLTVAELTEAAREAAIAGRSTMRRDELVAALRAEGELS